jgi:Zn-dependent peptidase ImmA (M78 family)
MKSETEISGTEIVRELLQIIWIPVAQALKVQKDFNVRSLEETSAAAERAGYEVCYADLPAEVSGFAEVIGGKPHIVVNRAKSLEHQQYTVPHELGHHVLHLNPSRNPVQSVLSIEGVEEFQAHMFATMWVMRVAHGKEREGVLRQNPESSAFLFLSVFMTVGVLVVALLSYLLPRLFRTRLSSAVEEK